MGADDYIHIDICIHTKHLNGRGKDTNVMDSDISVSEFEFQTDFCVHILSNTLWKDKIHFKPQVCVD